MFNVGTYKTRHLGTHQRLLGGDICCDPGQLRRQTSCLDPLKLQLDFILEQFMRIVCTQCHSEGKHNKTHIQVKQVVIYRLAECNSVSTRGQSVCNNIHQRAGCIHIFISTRGQAIYICNNIHQRAG